MGSPGLPPDPAPAHGGAVILDPAGDAPSGAGLVESADTAHSNCAAARHAGSSPAPGTPGSGDHANQSDHARFSHDRTGLHDHRYLYAGAKPATASPMRWTRIAFSEPGIPGGEPATMTT